MKDISHLLLDPTVQCGEPEQTCPLLRVCPGCGFRFVTTRGRRQHGHTCVSDHDVLLVEVQHRHLIEVHRIRRRRGRSGG